MGYYLEVKGEIYPVLPKLLLIMVFNHNNGNLIKTVSYAIARHSINLVQGLENVQSLLRQVYFQKNVTRAGEIGLQLKQLAVFSEDQGFNS